MTLDVTIGGAASDSYGTLAEYQAYGAAFGWTMGADDAADEANMRRAAMVLDQGWAFRGMTQYKAQARAWPRIYVGWVDGWDVDPDFIPTPIKHAQFEIAHLLQQGLDPLATVSGVVASTRAKAGPVETETTYSGGGLSTPRMVAVEGLLRPYVASGRGQVPMVRG